MARPKNHKTRNPTIEPVILLAGFGPFPDVPENASARVVTKLAEQARVQFSSVRFITEIFPTEWQAAPQRLSQLFRELRPTLMLLFGVAREAKGFRIETQGVNACAMRTDAAGECPTALQVTPEGPPSYAVTIPTRDIVEHLQARGLPATLSDDAGGYLCNAVLYHALTLARGAQRPCQAGFIHIPVDLSVPPLDEAAALAGGLEIIRVCLEAQVMAVG